MISRSFIRSSLPICAVIEAPEERIVWPASRPLKSTAKVSHVLISESIYTVPRCVPDEASEALAVVAEFTAYAASSAIDGVS